MTLRIGQTFEGYVIEELLGSGGFGEVYKARHWTITVPSAHGQQPLYRAIKELSHTQGSVIDRFKQEAGVLIHISNLPGSNVTAVYDLKEVNGRYYLIMEYVAGGTLALAAHRQLPEPVLVRIGIEVCKGLEVMHHNAPTVVHRDMKPENVKVEFAGAQIRVKILDLGVAYVLSGTPKREVVGTFAFAGPAQMRGEFANPAMDQHSLGTTMYFCMMDPSLPEDERYAPFPYEKWGSAAERNAILSLYPQQFQQAVKSNFTSLPNQWDGEAEARRLLGRTVYTPQFQAIVMKMMAYNAAEKFDDISDVRRELEKMAGLGASTVQRPTPQSPTPPPPAPSGDTPPPPPAGNFSGAFLPVKKKTTGSNI